MMTTRNKNMPQTITVQTSSHDGHFYSFFHTPGVGSKGVKSRIYDFIEKLIILDFPIDHNFFRNYINVDTISVIDTTQMFYTIVLKNNIDNECIKILTPCQVFNPKATAEDLFMYADVMLDYMEYFV